MNRKLTFNYMVLLIFAVISFLFVIITAVNACSQTNPIKGYSRYVTDTKNITVENIDTGYSNRCFVRQYSWEGTKWVLKHQVACEGYEADTVVGNMISNLN